MSFKPPKPLMYAQSMAFGLDHLLFNKERMAYGDYEHRVFYNPLKRPMLLGFVIPDFQRSLVWSEDQQLSLIDSIWRCIPIGTYAVNFSTDKMPPKVTNVLLDGQQRLNALRAYWDDEIVYRGYKWSEIDEISQRHFVSKQFPQMRTNSHKTAELHEYYNAMNFGGTDHKEEDRAC